MEYNPNTKTMESSKKNLGVKTPNLENLLNENWEKVISKQFKFDQNYIVYFKHKTEDFVISEDLKKSKWKYRITTDNSFSYYGEWYPQYHLSEFHKGYNSISSLVNYSHKI